ncbi:tRNA1(Val) (adenine(37)-N6)-methyltransferase [Actibacterium lipolyticum]|uniref:tRNA1(Val) (Adenine(37)-N6)-methyltransferase n=1 Tax=Actibacterium lipolyticum TaxID=1524263 RepID=A0A238KSY1_9RHOB|nr:methyltransferase [Actibacterium lipolyticum]SMX45711.1 tRNA1(Val) (adenine(37)-N6)-methyltransferase [Actibacterium lipolyticum]
MGFKDDLLSQDSFLGGQLAVHQPKAGYRAGVDPVFLAASVRAHPGETVLELGCGAGVASLCLGSRVAGLTLTGIELQHEYAALARRNSVENGVPFEVVEGDIAALPAELRQRSFDHVIANPPYFLRENGVSATDEGRETALGERTPLSVWVDVAMRRLVQRGQLTMIQRAERLPELMSALDARAGNIEVLPLAPREGRKARLVLLRAIKSGRGPFALLPPLTLHEGAFHDGDRESYTPEVKAVLRDGAALRWPEA